MSTAFRWLDEVLLSRADLLPPLLVKVTILLGAAWLLHVLLAGTNPRWRVLTWRLACVGILAVGALAACPPLFRVACLPPVSASTDSPIIAKVPGSETAPTSDPPSAPDPSKDLLRPDDLFGKSIVFTPPNVDQLNREPADRHAPEPAISSAERIVVVESARSAASIDWSWPLAIRTGLFAIWALGVAVGVVKTLVGYRQLIRIRHRAVAPPESLIVEAQRAARTLEVRSWFDVRLTTALPSPCLVGIVRPLILLPAPQVASDRAEELPSILAHELSHLRGRDAGWNGLFHALSVALWFHPFAWRIRLAHADMCDAVCDAVAAGYVGDAGLYSRNLARITLRISGSDWSPGLAMARRSGVQHRIEALRRHVFLGALPRRQVVLALTLTGLLSFALGELALTRSNADPIPVDVVAALSADEKISSEAATEPAPIEVAAKEEPVEPEKSRLTIRTRTADGDDPLADVTFEFHGFIDPARINQELKSDESGTLEFTWPAGAKVRNLWFTARRPGYVPLHYSWRDDRQEIELPKEVDLQFETGHAIGGVVRDESGRPIAGASVELTMPITSPKLANWVFTAANLVTDDKGEWKWDGAPKDAPRVSVRVRHADYIDAGLGANAGIANHLVLKQGLTVTGKVTDREGKPLAGVACRLGFDRFGTNEPQSTTDADGTFTLKNCQAGRSLVTVQGAGFAPQFQEVLVAEKTEPLTFQLEPGKTLRVRVVDKAGEPVPGVIFVTDTWRGHRSLEFRVNTDAEGRAVWNDAPDDPVLCDVLKQGYMAVRRMAFKAGDELQVVTLNPPLAIHGKVTDAAGEPVHDFRIVEGSLFDNRKDVYWSHDEGAKFTNGEYTYKFDEPLRGRVLQVIAPGFQPANSRTFTSDEGNVSFDFRLEPGNGPSGVVLLPDGKPAVGAEVGLATQSKRAHLSQGRFDARQNGAEVVTTDAEGRFQFSAQTEKAFLLIAMHDGGFAEAFAADLKKSEEIRLIPWGRLEGRVLIGETPDSDREVSFQPKPPDNRRTFPYVFSYNYTTKTDPEGRFAFERVMPGQGYAARVVVTEFLKSWSHAPAWNQLVEIKPGATTKVQIGGTGRPVTGRVRINQPIDVAIDWTTNEPAEILAWDKGKNSRTENYSRYLANVLKSGRFRIPDVPAGDYQLSIPVNNPPSPNACGAGTAIGRATLEFTIPEIPGGRSNSPFDLGEIEAKMFDTLDPGEVAPDFVAAELGRDEGATIRLKNHHGKLVLLDFWATWCAPCVAELSALKELYAKFKDDPRFVMIGLSCDTETTVARRLIDSQSLPWAQAFVGDTQTRVPTQYTVRSFPATFLIAPDGKVLAKNLHGPDLEKAIAAALADAKLFAAAGAPPPRFPVTRFDVKGPSAELPAGASTLILRDTDPNYGKESPHDDQLLLVGDAGATLWERRGFNAAGSVGAAKTLAFDRTRQRLYVIENGAQRLSAWTLAGERLWNVDAVDVDCLALDGESGNLWTSGGPRLNSGETVVFGPDGTELAAWPHRAIDLAASPRSDAFWLVGYQWLKLDREGTVLFQKPVAGWCCASASIDPRDGSLWIAERNHSDLPESKNGLWLLASDGAVRRELNLGETDVWGVTCHPQTGDAWFCGYNTGVCRVGREGEVLQILKEKAHQIAISPTTGEVWVGTEDGLLKIDASGKVLARSAFSKAAPVLGLLAF